MLLPEKLTQASYKCGFDIRAVLCASVATKFQSQEREHNQVIGINMFYCLRQFVVVYKLVNVVLILEWYCVPVYQVSESVTLTQPKL